MPALIEHLCLQRCSQFGCGRAGGKRSEWGPAGVGSSCQPAAAEMAGAVEDIHSGFSLSSTGKWMPRMAAPLEAPNGCYSARTPAKLAMAGRMAGLLEPALQYGFFRVAMKCRAIVGHILELILRLRASLIISPATGCKRVRPHAQRYKAH